MNEYPIDEEDSEALDTSPDALDDDSDPETDKVLTPADIANVRGYSPNKRAVQIRRAIEQHRERAELRALIDHEPWGEYDARSADDPMDRGTNNASTQ
ncbi:MAG: hypothetical protein OEQ18_07430 [Gammaproteobacteria bacterium]|nr:hypothetical protein [Gammaproteobacteria bacterium]